MPQPYLLLFDRLALSSSEVLARAEPVLANSEFVFSGLVQKFERGKDGDLFYRLETFTAETLSEGAAEAAGKEWPGVSFECRYLGKDVTLGFFADGDHTIMTLDEDTVLFYEREKDSDIYKAWAAMVVRLMEAVGAKLSVYQRGGEKGAVNTEELLDNLKQGALAQYESPIHVVVAESLFAYEDAAVLDLDKWRVRASTSGYTIVTWLHA